MEEDTISLLVIDSDAASRNYLSTAMQKNHYRVILAASGREGLVMAWQYMPNIIIVDPMLADMSGGELVNRLRQDHRTATVPCIAFSRSENPQEMTELLSAGYDEYVVKSSQAIPTLLELIPRLLLVKAGPKKNGLLFVFLSAKGGVGTSSLCSNIAMCLGRNQPEASLVVLDLVLPIGSIADIVGYSKSMNIVNVTRENPDQTTASFFKENLPAIPTWYFSLLAGSPDPESANQLAVGRIGGIISALQDAYDYVFVDLGRALSRISLPIIQSADVIALVLSNDLAAVTLTSKLWEYLKTQGVEAQHVYPILNRAVGLEGMTKAEVDQVLGMEIRMTVPYMGGNFALADNRHEPVATKFPNDSATIMLLQAASQMDELGKRIRGQQESL